MARYTPQLRPRIVQLPSLNRTKCTLNRGVRSWKGRGSVRISRVKIDMTVIHSTAGAFVPSLDWLRKRDRPTRTSAHYIVAKDGGIVQLVDDSDQAWHAGYGRWDGRGGINARSLGIELENANDSKDPYPVSQIESCLWLCVRAHHQYGIPQRNVVGHNHVDPQRKTDPAGFPWEDFRASLSDAVAKPSTN